MAQTISPSLRRLFTGFSTYDTETTGNWRLYDIDLVRRDLLNHFHTRVGERVMRPDFGCAIWDYLMEPMTDGNVNAVRDECKRVIESDPRVQMVDINLLTYDNGIRVEITVNYVPLAVVETFSIDFERREQTRYQPSSQGGLA